MRNRTFEKLKAGNPVFGFGAGIGSPLTTEMLAAAGMDFVFLDGQHGSFGNDRIIDCLIATGGYVSDAVARVPVNDFTVIGRFLDDGCLGIVVPMVNNREDAQRAADAMRFPPVGNRSWGWGRAARYGPNYANEANDQVFLAVQIETITAVENAEEILSTPGVDGCWLGPSDLSLSMGLRPSERFTNEDHARAVEKVLQACKNTGKFPGYATSGPKEALALAERGFQFLTVGYDSGFVVEGIARQMAELGLQPHESEG